MGLTKVKEILEAREENRDSLRLQLTYDRRYGESEQQCKVRRDRSKQQCKVLQKALAGVKDPSNWNLGKLEIFFEDYGRHDYISKELHELLQTVASMFPSIVSVEFCTDVMSCHPGRSFCPCKVLTAFLQKMAPQLQSLTFWMTGVFGEREELLDFYGAIERLNQLNTLAFQWDFPISEWDDPGFWYPVEDLTPLFASVSKLSALRNVEISGLNRFETSEPNDFSKVLALPHLKSVRLWRIDPANETALKSVADILVKKGVKIRYLKINFSWVDEFENFSGPADRTGPHWSDWSRLANAIGNNTSLEKLTIIFDSFWEYWSLDDLNCAKLNEFLSLTANTIGENSKTALKEFSAKYVQSHSPIGAFAKVVETNYTLEKVDIQVQVPFGEDEDEDDSGNDNYDSGNDEQLKMYLRLNQHGRKRFMENPTAIPLKEWADMFAKLDDTRCVNYYLIRFPWLIQQGLGLSVKDDHDGDEGDN